jgi:hypothetical protein
MDFQADKKAFNAAANASMREYLRSKTWVEKVESIERMRAASKIARAAMKKAQAAESCAAAAAAGASGVKLDRSESSSS